MQTIPLYPGSAPYSEYSPGQLPPSLADFSVPGSRGAVVVCPGGGYTFKAEHEGNPIAEALNSMGISAYVLDYRVAPCHPEAPLSDAKRALRLVRSEGAPDRKLRVVEERADVLSEAHGLAAVYVANGYVAAWEETP